MGFYSRFGLLFSKIFVTVFVTTYDIGVLRPSIRILGDRLRVAERSQNNRLKSFKATVRARGGKIDAL